MSDEIHTPADLIKAIGGVSRAAIVLGEKYPSTISNWIRAGTMPASKYLRHQATLKKLGIKAPAKLWFGEEAAA
jgi:hypothetical protein